ncbi:hypothetical protein [Bosea sp. (in: a-proteobacteria)]|jgi:hypothetical protein|uniref:hypothetical protein n=1 Tax=Bosea sp. (in: a-proteobacteria) TaxID=1871050 RepID=UPI0035655742
MAGNATHQAAVLGALGRGLLALDDIAAHLPMPRRSVVEAVSKLIVRSFVEREERGRYRMTPAGVEALASQVPMSSGPRGRLATPILRLNTMRQRCWTAMRIRKLFTVADIAMLAAGPTNRNPEIATATYLRGLARSGYVLQLPTRVRRSSDPVTSNGWFQWQLERDTGERAPIVRELHRDVFDPNTGEATPWR